MSTLAVATIKSASSAAPVFQNTSGTEIGQLAKVWCCFSGTGTVAIQDSFNTSSITDQGTGEYKINYSSNFSNSNYCIQGGVIGTSNADSVVASAKNGGTPSADRLVGATQFECRYAPSNSLIDCDRVSIVVFGQN